LTCEAARLGWDWKEAFAACSLPSEEQPGILFEQFVAAVLAELGVTNVTTNTKVVAENGQVLQEVDIVANYRGRLLVFDCKLRAEQEEGTRVESLTSQIRQASAIRVQLGGLGCQLLLIRPSRFFSKEEAELCRALGLQFLDANETAEFFRKLASFCRYQGDLPPSLKAAQEEFDRRRQSGEQSFLTRPKWSRCFPTQPPVSVLLPLSSELNHLMRNLNQDWIAFQIDNKVWIRGALTEKLDQDAIAQTLGKVLEPLVVVNPGHVRISKSNRTFSYVISVDKGETTKAIKGRLATYAGKKMFEEAGI